jgi:hypothetical protein
LITVVFEVDRLALAYAMQLRRIRDFGIDRSRWNRMFKGIVYKEDEQVINDIKRATTEEGVEAQKLRETVEKKWEQRENDVLAWLKELTKVDFTEPLARVCVVPFVFSQTPFKDIPLIIVGKIRKGWDYPETIAHELAHILFNQNFNIESEVEHPYVQLIEEEIAVRLGARSKYFDYQIPDFADWIRKAQRKERAWRRYMQCTKNFKDISQFIKENDQ